MSVSSPSSSRPSTPVAAAPPNKSLEDDGATPIAGPSSRRYRFTWDSERRGPESVSGTTTYGQDYTTAPPAGLGYHFGSTTSLNLGALPSEWSSTKHGFHAISTVLNNPHKRQAPPKAHSSLPAVLPAELPRVRRKDFDSYLRAISPEWDKLAKHLHSNAQAPQPSPSEFELQQDAGPSSPPPGFGTPAHRGSLGSFASLSSLEPPTTARLQTLSPAQGKYIPPLDSVPPVFFKPDFDLGDPNIFADVTEQTTEFSADGDVEGDPTSLSHSLPLLEKFSHYADTIELHLANEIALRAPSFFAALTNLHTLQSESTATLSQITRLRGMLEEVDVNVAKKGLEVIRLEQQMQSVESLGRGVIGVKGVVKITGEAREMVGRGKWGDALGVMSVLEGMWDTDASSSDEVGKLSTSSSKPNGTLSPLSSTPEDEEEIPEPPPPAYAASPPSGSSSELLYKHNHPPLSIPLSQLQAFSALPTHLRSLTMEIASSLSGELISVMREDLLRRIDLGVKPDSNSDLTNGVKKQSATEELKDRVCPLLDGLAQTRGLKEATLSWREVVLEEVQGVARKRFSAYEVDQDLPDTPTPAKVEGSSNSADRPLLADYLRGLSHNEFIVIMRAIYGDMLNAVNGLQIQAAVLGEVLEAIEAGQRAVNAAKNQDTKWSRPPPTPVVVLPAISSSPATPKSSLPSPSPSLVPLLATELTEILSSSTELAHTQVARLLSYRSEIHSSLSLEEFVELFNESWEFVVKCEIVCRRMIVGLRGAVVGQAKLFLQTFHQSRLSQSAKLVEDEQWSPQEVSPEVQRTANIIVDAAMKDPTELILRAESKEEERTPTTPTARTSAFLSPLTGLLRSPSPANAAEKGSPKALALPPSITSKASSNSGSTNGSSGKSKHLYVENHPYFTVSATSSVLSLLTDYLSLVLNLRMLTTDAMPRVIEFLKAFNSRTCQVVLGAGAMRSAGLKNITAKHLALASQSLSIMIALVPYIRETFRRHLSAKQAVMLVEFDKLKRDYQEHQNEIHAKLIAIMGDRLTAHIKSLQTVDWSVSKPGGGVNDYMEVLVKETVTLHKVLSRYLSTTVVEDVMSQVFAAINHRLSEEYGKIELPHAEAKKRLLADAKFLHQKLSALKNVGAPSAMLETVIQEKPVPRLPGHASPTLMLPPNSAASNAGTNQRLKGLLFPRRVSSDKALPTIAGVETRTQTPPPTSGVTRSASPAQLPPSSRTGAATPPITAPPQSSAEVPQQVNGKRPNGIILDANPALGGVTDTGDAPSRPPVLIDKELPPTGVSRTTSGFRQVVMPLQSKSELEVKDVLGSQAAGDPPRHSISGSERSVDEAKGVGATSFGTDAEVSKPSSSPPQSEDSDSSAVSAPQNESQTFSSPSQSESTPTTIDTAEPAASRSSEIEATEDTTEPSSVAESQLASKPSASSDP